MKDADLSDVDFWSQMALSRLVFANLHHEEWRRTRLLPCLKMARRCLLDARTGFELADKYRKLEAR